MARMQYPEGRGLRRLPVRRPARHRLPGRASTASRPTTSTSSSARTTSSPCTTATRRRSASCATLPAQRQDPGRGPGRALPPHRRRDGRSLPAGGRQARGAARRAREERSSSSRDRELVRADPRREARRRVAAARSSRRSATSIARLARREFVDISTEMAFRFRDVYDHLVRHRRRGDRSSRTASPASSTRTCRNVSNRLNEVMKVLTVVVDHLHAADLLAGVWGMNVPLPHFPAASAAQFWWILVGDCMRRVSSSWRDRSAFVSAASGLRL